jgi:uncharacterized protein
MINNNLDNPYTQDISSPLTIATELSLSIPNFSSILSESNGANANPGARTSVVATLTRTGDITAPLTVNLTSSNPALAVLASVIIPANQTSIAFSISAVNDTVINGSRAVTITASAAGSSDQTVNVQVDDDDFITRIGTVSANSYNTGAAEIPAYDPASKRLFVVNGNLDAIDVYDLSNPNNPSPIAPITFAGALAGFVPNSVAVKNGIVAVALEAPVKTDLGQVAFYNAATAALINSVQVGALPDMVTFSPDGTKVLTANEGEPNSYNNAGGTISVDPEGSISIIDISGGVVAATVSTASFASFNDQLDALRAAGVRIYGPNATVAQDLEPEYITFSGDGQTAYVTLQENNAIAVVDVATATVTEIRPLGLKNLNTPGNGIDPSDQDGGINIRQVPVFGMYQPDAIASFTVAGTTYLVTANEGEARSDWPGYSDEVRVSNAGYVLDPTVFPNAAALKQNTNLGRLNVSNAPGLAGGDTDGDGDFDQIQTFGTRSFTIWNATTGAQVYDSGNFIEQLTASYYPNNFNTGHTTNALEDRSDNKGPEPEGVVLGTIGSRTYAFVGLERIGGVIVQDITNPTSPTFVQYINTRNFSQTPGLNSGGDLGVEGLAFISAENSPNGRPLLVTTNEVSGTTSVFQINLTRIRDIQGAAHTSPLVGQAVNNITGIVTALHSNGFYMQDPSSDGNDATSEAIFVFTGSAPTVAVGDSVSLSGTVSESRPGGVTSPGLTVTQIVSPTVTVLSSGNPLPTATVIGAGGRIAPTSTIYATSSPVDVETVGTLNPTTNGLDFYESLEGMRVQINNAVAVSPTNSFGEIWVLPDSGSGATGGNTRGGISISAGDFNPERIQLDDTLAPTGSVPAMDVGAQFSGPVVGVVDYSVNNYEVLPTSYPTVTSTPLTLEITELQGAGSQLTVASFNIENFSPATATEAGPWGASRANAIAAQIINNLKSPDIIGLQGIQDNNGLTDNGVVAADQTYQTLINAIVAAGGPTYQFANIDPVNNTNGGAPGANIRAGFLYNPTRVSFNSVSLIDPTNPAFNASSKPIIGNFTFNRQTVTVINNHFNSKGDDQPLFGRNQPPSLTSETLRLQQAQIVNDFVDSQLVTNPNANIVVVGNLNDFQFSNPLNTLRGLPDTPILTDLAVNLPEAEQYTHNLEGNSQTLDHILVTHNLLPGSTLDIVHINSEFAAQVSHHDPKVARFNLVAGLTFTLPTIDASKVTSAITVNLNQSTGTLVVQEEIPISYNLTGFTNVIGTVQADSITGDAGNNVFLSGAGNDTITGGAGNDTILGGDGNDTLLSGTGNDQIYGGKGSDLIEGDEGDDQIEGDKGNDILFGGDGNDSLSGDAGNDQLYGDEGNDVTNGGDGNDFMVGGIGQDMLIGGNGNDALYGEADDDQLDGSDGNDQLWGETGNDLLLGQKGNDVLVGGDGNDILVGGAGNNTLRGNAGDDRLYAGDLSHGPTGSKSDKNLLEGGIGLNQLYGANSRDGFTLVRDGVQTIFNYQDNFDYLLLAENITFGQLKIVQGTGVNAHNTLIHLGQETGPLLATLVGVRAQTIDRFDFVRA